MVGSALAAAIGEPLELCAKFTQQNTLLKHFVDVDNAFLTIFLFSTVSGHSNILRHKRVLLLESGGGVNLKEAPEDFSSAVCALSHSTKQLLTSEPC